MPQPNESGVGGASAGELLRRAIHGIVDAVSILAVNIEIIVESPVGGDQALLDDTRAALTRVVKLAREAQRIQNSPAPAG